MVVTGAVATVRTVSRHGPVAHARVNGEGHLQGRGRPRVTAATGSCPEATTNSARWRSRDLLDTTGPIAEFSDDFLEALRACDEQLGLIIDLFPDDLMEQLDTDLSPDSRANGSQSIGFQPGMSRPQGRQGLGRRLVDRLAAM